MIAIRGAFRRLRADDRGATVIEYGLICALIVLGCMVGLMALGGGTGGMWTKVGTEVLKYM